MLKPLIISLLGLSLAASSANAMCCGGKGEAASKEPAKMQCMKMDMTKSDDRAQSEKPGESDPHAGMDMSKDGAMDHSKMAGCCCGCCGGKKSS